jgi:hypothetical protein
MTRYTPEANAAIEQLQAAGFDYAEADMIYHGDMLGPALGAKTATLITSLREALEPFAEYARVSGYGRMVINDPTGEVFGIYSDEVAVVTKRDLARAARLAKKANPSRKETGI